MKKSIETLSAVLLGSILFYTDASLAQTVEPFAYPNLWRLNFTVIFPIVLTEAGDRRPFL